MILFCLLQVTQGAVYKTRVTVTLCDIKMIRAELIPTYSKCTIMILFCLLQVTQGEVYKTQVTVARCGMAQNGRTSLIFTPH